MRPTPFPLMLFAAGFGTRMGALTAHMPKPLIVVAGRPLIDHALDLAKGAGITRIVANAHYLADTLAAHLVPKGVMVSYERDIILETGGGLRAALPLLGPGPVLTLNTDAVWSGQNPVAQLMQAWDPARMDALLLTLPAEEATGHAGSGDFVLSDEGRVARAKGQPGVVYLGAQIIKPDALLAISEPVFSLNRLWDTMIAQGRAYAICHQGGWCDVGHPAGIAQAEAMLADV